MASPIQTTASFSHPVSSFSIYPFPTKLQPHSIICRSSRWRCIVSCFFTIALLYSLIFLTPTPLFSGVYLFVFCICDCFCLVIHLLLLLFLYSTSKWNYMAFVFLWLISHSIIFSSLCCYKRQAFILFTVQQYSIVHVNTTSFSIHLLMDA